MKWGNYKHKKKKQEKQKTGQEDEGYWGSVCTRFHQWHSVHGPELFGPSLVSITFHAFRF